MSRGSFRPLLSLSDTLLIAPISSIICNFLSIKEICRLYIACCHTNFLAIELIYKVKIDSEGELLFLVSSGIHLMRVIIYFEDLTDFHLISLAGICPNLISIDGYNDSHETYISVSGLREFIKKYPNVEVLRLSSCNLQKNFFRYIKCIQAFTS